MVSSVPEWIDLDGAARLCLRADLHPDGSFGEEWLVVTQDRLKVLTKNGTGAQTRYDLSLSEISEPKADNLVGGGALLVTWNGSVVELARYTNARVPRFAAAAGLLEKWTKGEEAEVPEDEEERRCPNCGIPREPGTNVCAICAPKSRTLKRLVGYLRPYWVRALWLSVISIVMTILGLLPGYLQKPLMDQVLVPQDPSLTLDSRFRTLWILVVLLLGSRVVIAVVSVVQGWLAAWVGNRITHDIRCQLYEHLQYTTLSFFDKRQMGTVISRVNQDTTELQRLLVWVCQDMAINFLQIVGIGVVLFIMNWKLALMVLVPAPLVVLLTGMFWRWIRLYMRRFFHNWGQVNSVLTESLTGLRVVRAFAQEAREIKRFRSQSDQLAAAGIKADYAWAAMFSASSLAIMAGTLLVWYFGGRQTVLGNITPGTIVAFLAYVAMFYMPMQQLSMLLNWSSRSLTAAERVFEVLDTKPEIENRERAREMPQIEGHIEFRDVTFGYQRHSPALKHVSFEVEPGEMIGLVGHSGAGKSTTINLLCRFYHVDDGQILIDGVPLNDIRIEDLRGQIGLVPQDTFLFSGTIADNISYAKPGATMEEIIRAAKIANAHDFIRRKPDGYETIINEGGQGISAGEKQRLAIARAVLHDPRILILDEATSQVDVETEKQIQEAVDRLVRGRTTIAIAHRLSTLKNADRLIVLKQGEIAEIGTHDELMAMPEGEFRKLVDTYQEISKVRAFQR